MDRAALLVNDLECLCLFVGLPVSVLGLDDHVVNARIEISRDLTGPDMGGCQRVEPGVERLRVSRAKRGTVEQLEADGVA